MPKSKDSKKRIWSTKCTQGESVHHLDQGDPTTGPHVARVCIGPWTHSGKIFKSDICWKAWGYICLTELLALDKVHLHKNN